LKKIWKSPKGSWSGTNEFDSPDLVIDYKYKSTKESIKRILKITENLENNVIDKKHLKKVDREYKLVQELREFKIPSLSFSCQI